MPNSTNSSFLLRISIKMTAARMFRAAALYIFLQKSGQAGEEDHSRSRQTQIAHQIHGNGVSPVLG